MGRVAVESERTPIFNLDRVKRLSHGACQIWEIPYLESCSRYRDKSSVPAKASESADGPRAWRAVAELRQPVDALAPGGGPDHAAHPGPRPPSLSQGLSARGAPVTAARPWGRDCGREARAVTRARAAIPARRMGRPQACGARYESLLWAASRQAHAPREHARASRYSDLKGRRAG